MKELMYVEWRVILPKICCLFFFMLPTERKKYYIARFAAVSLFLISMYAVECSVLDEYHIHWLIEWCFNFLIIFPAFLLCTNLKRREAAYLTIWVSCIYYFIYGINMIIEIVFYTDNHYRQMLMVTVSSLLLLVIIYYVIIRELFEQKIYQANDNQIIVGLGIFLPGVLLGNYFARRLEFSLDLVTLMCQTFISISCICVMYLHGKQICEMKERREKAVLEQILKNRENQYRISKENTELINQKCHDMKHQILMIRDHMNQPENEKYFEEILDQIKIYDNLIDTGNQVLNTILTEKMLFCESRHILLTCIADGRLLNFMSSVDVCDVIGNAIDNAIEAVEKVRAKDIRNIHLMIAQREQFLLVQVENSYEGKIEMVDGMPMTTKADHRNHGYGIKSICYTAEKYNGAVSIHTENSQFILRVLIPIRDG